MELSWVQLISIPRLQKTKSAQFFFLFPFLFFFPSPKNVWNAYFALYFCVLYFQIKTFSHFFLFHNSKSKDMYDHTKAHRYISSFEFCKEKMSASENKSTFSTLHVTVRNSSLLFAKLYQF